MNDDGTGEETEDQKREWLASGQALVDMWKEQLRKGFTHEQVADVGLVLGRDGLKIYHPDSELAKTMGAYLFPE